MAGLLIDPTPFLRQGARRPARYGEIDCALHLADYLMWARRLNRDPAEGLRGAYSTEEECHALLRREGGLLRIVRRIVADLGLERVDAASTPVGAFGVVRHTLPGDREAHFGAIRAQSGRLAIKCLPGMLYVRDARPIAMWMP